MADLEHQCDRCQKKVKASFGQATIDSRLRWYLSYSCNHCSSTVEMDDLGFPPDEIRQKIIDEEGEWILKIGVEKLKNKAKLLKILRKALDISIQEVSKRYKNYSNIISGTKTEMQWLKQLLENEGIEASIDKKV